MKVTTIQVPDDSVDFVEEFVERIGGSVEDTQKEKKLVKKVKKTSKKKSYLQHLCLESGKILILMQENFGKKYGQENFSGHRYYH